VVQSNTTAMTVVRKIPIICIILTSMNLSRWSNGLSPCTEITVE